MGSKKLDACGIGRMIYENLEEQPCVYLAYALCSFVTANRLSVSNCTGHFSPFARRYESM